MSSTETITPPTPQVDIIPPTPHISAEPQNRQEQDVHFTSLPPESSFVNYDHTEKYEDPKILRAGLTTTPRLILMTGIGSFWGFSIGAFLGGRQAGLQYLAENAHKLPTTVQGWYFYHKTKNYRIMLGGVKKGIRYAGKTGGLCLLYSSLEAALDDVRGEADVFNSVAAGITTGTIFSALTKLTRGSFRYSVMFGAVFGLAAGGLSDLHKYVSGDTPTYGMRISSLFKKKEIEESKLVRE